MNKQDKLSLMMGLVFLKNVFVFTIVKTKIYL